MKPTIVHVVQHLKPGGIETFALEFQRAAAPFYDVHIIALERSNSQGIKGKYHDSRKFIHILNKQPGWRPSLVSKIKELLAEIKPIYVHTHHIGPLIYGGLAARMLGIGCVIHTEHDAWHLNQQKRRLLQELCLKLVRPVLVADAEFVAQQVKALLPAAKPYVITNGVDTDYFKPSPIAKSLLKEKAGLPTELRFIGCAARLEPVKSHHLLIDALTQLPHDIGLLIAGTGSLEKALKQQVKRLKLDNRVFFLGHLDEMRSFYQLLDVFCLSSSNEGLPLAPLEAQACNVPVVLTNVGGCKEAICERTGKVVEPNNAQKLAKALKQRLTQPLQKSPRLFIEQKRSIKSMIKQYVALTQPSLRGKV